MRTTAFGKWVKEGVSHRGASCIFLGRPHPSVPCSPVGTFSFSPPWLPRVTAVGDVITRIHGFPQGPCSLARDLASSLRGGPHPRVWTAFLISHVSLWRIELFPSWAYFLSGSLASVLTWHLLCWRKSRWLASDHPQRGLSLPRFWKSMLPCVGCAMSTYTQRSNELSRIIYDLMK